MENKNISAAVQDMDRIEELDGFQLAQQQEVIENIMVRTTTTQMSFTSIMSALENRYFVIPDFQRMYRWTEQQVEELAISLVRGMPIPPIYCYTNKEQQKVILDGQQRILSLYLYYIGKYMERRRNAFINVRKAIDSGQGFRQCLEEYGLKEKKYVMKYMSIDGKEQKADITYHTLSEPLKRKIDFTPVTLIEIIVDSEEYKEKTLHKIFANLNIGGTPLSRQELRNGIYSCKFYKMLYQINDSCKKWRMLFNGNSSDEINKESKDVEMLLRMCAFQYYTKGSEAPFTLTGYRGNISMLLDNFSEEVQQFSEEQVEEYRQLLLSFFEALEYVSGRNKSLAFVSLFVVWNRLSDKPRISKEKYEKIIGSSDYKKTILSGTSERSEIEKRLNCVYEQLSSDDTESDRSDL